MWQNCIVKVRLQHTVTRSYCYNITTQYYTIVTGDVCFNNSKCIILSAKSRGGAKLLIISMQLHCTKIHIQVSYAVESVSPGGVSTFQTWWDQNPKIVTTTRMFHPQASHSNEECQVPWVRPGVPRDPMFPSRWPFGRPLKVEVWKARRPYPRHTQKTHRGF